MGIFRFRTREDTMSDYWHHLLAPPQFLLIYAPLGKWKRHRQDRITSIWISRVGNFLRIGKPLTPDFLIAIDNFNEGQWPILWRPMTTLQLKHKGWYVHIVNVNGATRRNCSECPLVVKRVFIVSDTKKSCQLHRC